MAPEQCRGATVDARSDLYACGVMLFEMLTGKKPFHSAKDDPIEVVGKHMHKPAPRLAELLPRATSAALEPVVARALAKSPSERYGSAGELSDAIESAIRGDTVPIETFDPHELGLTPNVELSPSLALAIEPAPAPAPAAPPAPAPIPAPASAPAPVPAPSPSPSRPSPSPSPNDDLAAQHADATEPVRRVSPPPRWIDAAAGGAAFIALVVILRHCGGGATNTTNTAGSGSSSAVVASHAPPPPDARSSAPALVDAAPTATTTDADVEPPADDPAGRALYDANHRVAAGDIPGALHILETAHAAYSANPDIPYLAGRLYLQQQRYHEAISSLRAAVDLFPGFLDDPELAKLVVTAFLTAPSRNAEIARFLHDIRATAAPLLRDAAATNPRAQAELQHL